MNWEDLQFFLTIARSGSLSGAARVLGVNQATVSRRLASLEQQLNVRL
ncbi:MAG: LysR family transcriptional regulator, partial [Pseudomonas sp.]